MYLSSPRLFPQPLTGILTMLLGTTLLVASWGWALLTPSTFPRASSALLAMSLAAAIVLAHRFPIHVRQETKLLMGTVPLYLCCVLLPPCLAITAVGISTLTVEVISRSKKGGYASDGASQIGRFMAIALGASLIAHIHLPSSEQRHIPLLGAAAFLWLGDILTSPLLLSPITGEPAPRVAWMVAREGGAAEAAQYLVAILGALAAQQALWALVLLFLPTALVYQAFKNAKDLRESSRQLLTSVVETSGDSVILLDPQGRVMLANGRAAGMCGFTDPEALFGLPIQEVARPQDEASFHHDLQRALAGDHVYQSEHVLVRADGTTFVAEVTWTPVSDRSQGRRAITFVARDITERKNAERALEQRALTDELTSLPNRAQFHNRLRAAMEAEKHDETPFALMLLDLNRFKHINDTYGHKAGDAILREVSRRLCTVLREGDTVARLGGDEFAVLLPAAEEDGARLVATRIVTAVNRPLHFEGKALQVGASIGIALCPDHGRAGDELLRLADMAMYAIKRQGGGFRVHADEDSLAGTA